MNRKLGTPPREEEFFQIALLDYYDQYDDLNKTVWSLWVNRYPHGGVLNPFHRFKLCAETPVLKTGNYSCSLDNRRVLVDDKTSRKLYDRRPGLLGLALPLVKARIEDTLFAQYEENRLSVFSDKQER